jgi:ribosomal protein S18 acetylase RimI-like enzyme
MRAQVHIVPFENRYASCFKELNLVWLTHYFSVEDIDRDVLEHPEERVLGPGGMIFFALHETEPVGTTAVVKHDNGVYELSKLAVREDMKRGGIGRMLIEEALHWVRSHSGTYVFLESNSILEPAIRLYERAGFKHEQLAAGSHYSRTNLRMGMNMKATDVL